MSTTIRETCSCGASFEYTGNAPASSARLWRDSHRHEAPNPCGYEPRFKFRPGDQREAGE